MIKIKELKFTYAGEQQPNLEIEELNFKPGECVVLSGASGSGKSTLTKVINALIPNFFEGDLQGELELDNQNARAMDVCAVSKIVSSVFQDPASQFFTESVDSELAFTCENFGLDKQTIIDNICNAVELVEISNLLGEKLDKLSGGQKQKIAIATALTLPVKILLLDEPSSNLDYNAIEKLSHLLAKLKNKGFTIIIAEHRLYYLQSIFDRFLYMQNGKIIHDYTRNEFLKLGSAELNQLGLRRLNLFEKLSPATKPPATTNNNSLVAQFKNIHFTYPKTKKVILDKINIDIRAGDIIALIGANGAGKTTLAKILTGILKSDQAQFYFAKDANLQAIDAKQLHAHVNFVMQNVSYQMFGDSAFNELRLGNENIENLDAKIHSTLDNLGLSNYENTHPFSLSMGQRQRLVLAATFVGQKSLTILDEPTSGLDFSSMQQVSSIIKQIAQDNKGVLIITHDYELIEKTCNRMLLLKNGNILEDIDISTDKAPIQKIFTSQLT